jgi:hypothetical protein
MIRFRVEGRLQGLRDFARHVVLHHQDVVELLGQSGFIIYPKMFALARRPR